MASEFLENSQGVHAMGPENSEYTICGLACDIGCVDEDLAMEATVKTIVTCNGCIEMIRHCKKFKLR